MIIIINKLRICIKPFCEIIVTGSNLRDCAALKKPGSMTLTGPGWARTVGRVRRNRHPGMMLESTVYRRGKFFDQQFRIFPVQAGVGD